MTKRAHESIISLTEQLFHKSHGTFKLKLNTLNILTHFWFNHGVFSRRGICYQCCFGTEVIVSIRRKDMQNTYKTYDLLHTLQHHDNDTYVWFEK